MAYNDSMKLRDAVDSVESRVAYTDDKAFRSLQRDLQSVCTRVRRYYGLPEKMYLGTPVVPLLRGTGTGDVRDGTA